MPTVIARLEPKSDAHDAVLDVLREHVPLVHAEAGCDLYSVHSDGRIIVIVESWETGSALKSHATGPIFTDVNRQLEPLLSAPPRIDILTSVPMGDTQRGTIG
jgi:quinol monooxygenase YgiN